MTGNILPAILCLTDNVTALKTLRSELDAARADEADATARADRTRAGVCRRAALLLATHSEESISELIAAAVAAELLPALSRRRTQRNSVLLVRAAAGPQESASNVSRLATVVEHVVDNGLDIDTVLPEGAGVWRLHARIMALRPSQAAGTQAFTGQIPSELPMPAAPAPSISLAPYVDLASDPGSPLDQPKPGVPPSFRPAPIPGDRHRNGTPDRVEPATPVGAGTVELFFNTHLWTLECFERSTLDELGHFCLAQTPAGERLLWIGALVPAVERLLASDRVRPAAFADIMALRLGPA